MKQKNKSVQLQSIFNGFKSILSSIFTNLKKVINKILGNNPENVIEKIEKLRTLKDFYTTINEINDDTTKNDNLFNISVVSRDYKTILEVVENKEERDILTAQSKNADVLSSALASIMKNKLSRETELSSLKNAKLPGELGEKAAESFLIHYKSVKSNYEDAGINLQERIESIEGKISKEQQKLPEDLLLDASTAQTNLRKSHGFGDLRDTSRR